MSSKPQRLTLRIAAYTCVALLFAAGAILWFVNSRTTSQAENQAVNRAQLIADALLHHELREADFVRPVTGPRRAQLDEIFQRVVHTEGILRMNLIAPSGQITYSTSPALIGSRPPHEQGALEPVLDGKGVSHVDEIDLDGRGTKVLETYLPVQPLGGGPVGVFELYQDHDAGVTAQARTTLYPVAGFLAIAIFVLCAALVPILRRVTAAVEIRNRQLVQRLTLERAKVDVAALAADCVEAARPFADQKSTPPHTIFIPNATFLLTWPNENTT